MTNHILADKRASGVLMHITSLPGAYGIGDLGEAAYRFADCLAAAGQTFWQVLPLGPTGFADSPYAGFSAFAGNPLLISLDELKKLGWLKAAELEDFPSDAKKDGISYDPVIKWHNDKLWLAYMRFRDKGTPAQYEALKDFRQRNAGWLEDFALFMAIKDSHNMCSWREWPLEERLRQRDTMIERRSEFERQIDEVCFCQWLFFEQWMALKEYVNAQGLLLIGDIPFYVAEDSSDVWANRFLFDLDEVGWSNHIAGVPPDYFSATGQCWGNPIYHWRTHKRMDYTWWLDRIAAMLRMVDLLRIDHFRAFYNYWSVKADKTFWGTPSNRRSAVNGKWVYWDEHERTDFFNARMEQDNKARLIAENLGSEMNDVDEWLGKTLQLPGMQVLQFAVGDDKATEARFWPRRFEEGREEKFAVMYTGTHDNNTARGWWNNATGEDAGPLHKEQIWRLVNEWRLKVNPNEEPHWALIELAMRSNARVAIIPMQDILGLDERARMNWPQKTGYWRWRCTEADLLNKAWERLQKLTGESQRLRK